MVSSSDSEFDFGLPAEGQTRQINVGPTPSLEPDTKTIVGGESITEGEAPKIIVQIGGSIGKYQIRSKLGSGGMGAVYLAFDPLIEREVAIKVLTQEVGATSVALQRFLQEARAIGRLNHPNVVSIFDIDQWNGQYYLVMELLSGGSLADVVAKNGPLSWSEACQIVAQAASGLAAAHAAGMLHRDIKPENMMLTKDRIVKVVDFGLSKLVDAANDTRTAVTKQGQILGTPHYMSPEQFEATELDARTDIYSLGGSLFWLLTGRFPFQDCATIVQTMMAHLNKPVPPASSFDAKIPVDCDRIIARAMEKRPADRYQNANEFANDLMAVVQKSRTTSSVDVAATIRESSIDRTALTPINSEVVLLKSALIVEPNKMLAIMMRDAVVRCGAANVDVTSSKAEALAKIGERIPDLLITAMQLPDGQGLNLISELCQQSPLSRTCVVLNSNDSTIGDLIAAGAAAGRVLAPKKVRPDDVIRVVHAAGPCQIGGGPISTQPDTSNLRLIVISEFSKVPLSLANMIRQLGIIDVTILEKPDNASIPTDDIPTVVVRLRLSGRSTGDDDLYAKRSSWLPTAKHLMAEIQVDSEALLLRAVYRQGVTASVCRVFDAQQLTRLMQACRST